MAVWLEQRSVLVLKPSVSGELRSIELSIYQAPQSHVTVVNRRQSNRDRWSDVNQGRGGMTQCFNHLPAGDVPGRISAELIFQLHAALTKLGETFGIALLLPVPLL